MNDGENTSLQSKRLYMVVEHFKHGDALPIYARFRTNGRMAPEGLTYLSSWVNDNFERCYQLMETHDATLLEEWMAKWNDLIDFEVHVVITSTEAVARIGSPSQR